MDKKDMTQAVRCYRERLACKIAEYMDMGVTERTAAAVTALLGCLDMVRRYEAAVARETALEPCEAEAWVAAMENADGTTGSHWTLTQTTAAAKAAGISMEHVTEAEFWAAMNMVWSDYSRVADKYGVNRLDFFAELAKAFLCDKDGPGPGKKLAAYYRCVVLGGE